MGIAGGVQLAEGVAIAREMFVRVKQLVQGIHVSAPFGRVEVACRCSRNGAT